jgi:hypothetical protein
MALALHFFVEWTSIIDEIWRVLSPGGEFVFSLCHPSDLLYSAGPYCASYFTPTSYQIGRYGSGNVWVHRRSLEDILSPFFRKGFALTGLVEPVVPAAEPGAASSRAHRRLRVRPKFLCLRLCRP